MRIESPELWLAGGTWIAVDGGAMWMCHRDVRQFWNVPREKKIVLVASSRRVIGGQRVRVGRDYVDLPGSRQRERFTYSGLARFLEDAARQFKTRDFYGWIEVVRG